MSEAGELSTAAEGPPHRRYAGFDYLRSVAMLFVVIWHAGLAYSSSFHGFGWFVEDAGRIDFSVPQFVAMGFTIPAFFAVSGFFAQMLYQRRGLRFLLIHRGWRMLVPLALLVPVAAVFVATLTGGPLRFAPYHLWFVVYLVCITVLVAVAEHLLADQERLVEAVARVSRRALRSSWSPLVLTLPTLAMVLVRGAGLDGAMILGSMRRFVPDPYVLVYFGVFYLFGWMLYKDPSALRALGRRAIPLLVLGAALRTVQGIVFFGRGDEALGSIAQLAMQAGTALYSWLMVLGLVGAFDRYLSIPTRTSRYMSDSAYWCYLIHPVPLLVTQYLIAGSELPVAAKYTIVVAVTLAFVCLTYAYFVRYTVIGRLLHGPRQRTVKGAGSLKRRAPAVAVSAD